MSDNYLLEARRIKKQFGGLVAINTLDFVIEPKSIVSVIGPNGAGKTTTLRTISGLMQPAVGDIHFNGEDTVDYPPHELIPKGIVMVPEGRGVFSKMTVAENLELGAFRRNDKKSIKEDMERVYALFPRLAERKSQLSGTMSGGEQQMLVMGRAMMARPKLLLLDEPSMGLAPILVETVFDIVKEINEKEGVTVLLVEQNAHMSLQISHRGYVLQTGEIVIQGNAKELQKNEKVQKAYLGID